MASMFRVKVVRYLLDGKQVPKGTPGAVKHSEESGAWYGQGIPGHPPKKRIALGTDKTAAERKLDNLIRAAERGQTDLPDANAGRVLFTDLMDEFRGDLELGLASKTRSRRKPDPKQVSLCVQRVRDALTACRFISPSDLNDTAPAKLARHLEQRIGLARRDGGVSHQTAGFILAAVKRFTRWLSTNKRCPVRPDLFDTIPSFDATNHRVHARRECSPEELARILDAALTGPAPFKKLKGSDRYHLYLCAFATGFRAGELASLTPESFDLAGESAVVSLPGKRTKNKKPARQPLPPAVAVQLATYLTGKPANERIWPGMWYKHAARMLRVDLKAAAVPYAVVLDGEKRYLDMHAMRHSFISALATAGIGPRELQELARHSDPRLTLGVYSHTRPAQLSAAVNRLPLPCPSPHAGQFAHLSRTELEQALTRALERLAENEIDPARILEPFART